MEPKLFDIHSHLNLSAFNEDWPEVLDRTLTADCWTITVGADLASSKKAVEIANSVPEGVWATVGFHPTDAADLSDEAWNEVVELANDPKVVAVGECGLEYYRIVKSEELKVKSNQKELFRRHIELALSLNKPLMIHCRASEGNQDAYEDAIEILNEYKKEAGKKLRGDFHFFAGNWAVAQKCLELGFTLSFTGVITFANQYDEVIKNTPLDMLMAETDAPFVAPALYRGKRCEPLYVAEVVKKLAELKGIPKEKMDEITVQNARQMFGV
ncbi:MAG: TatD family hydrolase [Candidatus Vogelbacteria bacterium]|nr:TatD family hydrolase [Candidatus Vogelbacteria bacterium]